MSDFRTTKSTRCQKPENGIATEGFQILLWLNSKKWFSVPTENASSAVFHNYLIYDSLENHHFEITVSKAIIFESEFWLPLTILFIVDCRYSVVGAPGNDVLVLWIRFFTIWGTHSTVSNKYLKYCFKWREKRMEEESALLQLTHSVFHHKCMHLPAISVMNYLDVTQCQCGQRRLTNLH